MAAKKSRLLRVLSIIVGVLLLLLGAIMLLVALFGFAEEGFSDTTAAILFFGVTPLAGGILLLMTSSRLGTLEEAAELKASTPSSQQSAPVAAPVPAEGARVIETLVSPGTPSASPAPVAPTPAPGESRVQRLALRSDDILATLRDVRKDDAADLRTLSALISGLELDDIEGAPAISVTRLGRTKRYWLGFDEDGATDEAYDLCVSCEAALNVEDDIRTHALPATLDETTPGARAAVRRILELGPSPWNPSADLSLAYGQDAQASSGEWALRRGIAEFVENVPSPFRLTFDMRASVAQRVAAISLEIPRPRCMAIVTSDPTAKASEARAYALRSALLMAQGTLACSDDIDRVAVSCHEHGSAQTLLSLDVTRDKLEALKAAALSKAVDDGGFPQDESVRARFDPYGWFEPVTAHLALDDKSLASVDRTLPAELIDDAADDALRAATGAKRISDLGINEDAARVAAWYDLLPKLGDSTESAVSALVDARDAASNISVMEACARTSQALVEGNVDISETDAMRELFINGFALNQAFRRADKIAEDPEGNPGPALEVLDGVLDPIAQTGIYTDDSEHVFRFFGSMAERVLYNMQVDEGGREVRLVPDVYYHAHSLAARMRSAVGDAKRALAHADELIRIAPTSSDAIAVKVRVLENSNKIFDAASLLKEGLTRAMTARDACLLHYRLAFMQWKLGRGDLAVASYVRAIELRGPMADQAAEELEDLLSSDSALKRLDFDDARAKLQEADIPLGATDAQRDMVMKAAIVTCDQGYHGVSAPLVGVLCERDRDDVLIDVYRSLRLA